MKTPSPLQNPARSHIKGISVQFKMTEIILKFWYFHFFFDSITIYYVEGQGPAICTTDGKNLEILRKSKNYRKKFSQHLRSVLEDFEYCLEYFHIDFGVFGNIGNILKSRTRTLQVAYLHLQSAGVEDVLPYFDHQKLEKANLEFEKEKIDFDEIFKTDIWMMAKNSKWSFTVQSLTFGVLKEVKKTFTSPTTPRDVSIKFDFVDISALDELFGTLFKNENGEFLRIINIPGTKGSILETRILESSISFHVDDTEELLLSSLQLSKPYTIQVFENCLIMKNLLRYLGCIDIQRFRKLSRTVRNCVDTIKPDAKIHRMTIIVDDIDALRIDIFMGKYSSNTIFYGKNQEGNGCFVNRQQLNIDYQRQVLSDLELTLRFQKSDMEELFLSFPYYSYLKDKQSGYRREGVDYAMLERLTGELLGMWKTILQSRTQPLQVRKLKMEVFNQPQLLEILPYIDPVSLKTIEIGYPYAVTQELRYLEIDEISKLEQWKGADELVISDRTIVSTKINGMNLFHFLRVSVTVDTISSDDLVYLRNELLKRPNFQKFKVSFKRPSDHFGLMGPPFSKARNIITWYFRYPGQNQALCLLYYVSRAVVFSRVHMSAVPENAFFDT